MKGLNKTVLIIAKVLEVLHWLGASLMAFFIGIIIFAKDWIRNILTSGVAENGNMVKTYGFELTAVNPDGTVNMTVITIFAIGAFIILGLMAMIFRNVFLIIKTAEGKTKFSEGKTPFQKSIVRMMREIGFFFIFIPAVSLIFSIIAQVIVGIEIVEFSVSLESLTIGLFALCLSQFFNQGKQLQEDVDGLV